MVVHPPFLATWFQRELPEPSLFLLIPLLISAWLSAFQTCYPRQVPRSVPHLLSSGVTQQECPFLKHRMLMCPPPYFFPCLPRSLRERSNKHLLSALQDTWWGVGWTLVPPYGSRKVWFLPGVSQQEVRGSDSLPLKCLLQLHFLTLLPPSAGLLPPLPLLVWSSPKALCRVFPLPPTWMISSNAPPLLSLLLGR